MKYARRQLLAVVVSGILGLWALPIALAAEQDAARSDARSTAPVLAQRYSARSAGAETLAAVPHRQIASLSESDTAAGAADRGFALKVSLQRDAIKASGGVIYELGAGDKLRIRFYQRPELSGEFAVRADGHLSLPIVGTFPVRGRTPVELESLISRKFYETTKRQAYVVVDVIQRRPFYVVGDVNNPGTFSFVPRITVLHAVAIAGGMYRSPAQPTSNLGLARERWKLRDAQADVANQLVRRARLQAQLDRLPTLNVPANVAEFVGPLQAGQLVAAQVRLFEQNRLALEGREKTYTDALQFTKREVASLKSQLDRIRETEKLHLEELSRVRELFNRRLTPRFRVYEYQRLVVATRADAASLHANLIRTEQRRSQARDELAVFWPNESARLSNLMIEADAKLERSIRAMRASEDLLQRASGLAAGLQQARYAKGGSRFRITRLTKGKYVTIDAAEMTELRPGDVLRVASFMAQSSVVATTKTIAYRRASAVDKISTRDAELTRLTELVNQQSRQIAKLLKLTKQLQQPKTPKLALDDLRTRRGVSMSVEPSKSQTPSTEAVKQRPSLKSIADKKISRNPNQLIRRLQTELRRVGCYTGRIDGFWGPLSRAAITRFRRGTDNPLLGRMPTVVAYNAVRAHTAVVCSRTVKKRWRSKRRT